LHLRAVCYRQKHSALCCICSYDTLTWATDNSPSVGFNKGDGATFYRLPGSKSTAALQLTCTNSFSSNGCYTYRVDGGSILDASASNSKTATRTPSQTMSQALTQSQTSSQALSLSQTSSQSLTASVSPSPSVTAASLLMFDGTDERAAALPAPGTALTTLSLTGMYAVAFSVNESDSNCGPGTYALTSAVLALSQVSFAQSGVVLQLFTANRSTGLPISPVASGGSPFVSIPSSPSYVSISFSLPMDTSSAAGTFYTLVLSTERAVNIHAVSTIAPNGIPTPGRATAYASFSSGDGGITWSPQLPFRAIQLRGLKTSCAPTTSPSQTSSQARTSSQSGSQTLSPTMTSTQSQTLSQAPTITQTPSTTGFPVQSILDNTQALSAAILGSDDRVLSPASWRAVSFSLSESDTACGPGQYVIQSLSLPLSLNSTLSGNTTFSVVLQVCILRTVEYSS
jgi:hypothetical protein